MAATGLLKKAADNPDIIDDLILAGDKYAEQVKAGLPWIVVTTSLVEHNSKALLKASKMLQEGDTSLPEGLDSRHEFTKLHIYSGNNSFDITVVGSPDTVEEKLSASRNTLLKG